MKVFSPAFQGTALPKDVKTVLPCKYSGEMLSPNQKTNETVGGRRTTYVSRGWARYTGCQLGLVSDIAITLLILGFRYLLKIKICN